MSLVHIFPNPVLWFQLYVSKSGLSEPVLLALKAIIHTSSKFFFTNLHFEQVLSLLQFFFLWLYSTKILAIASIHHMGNTVVCLFSNTIFPNICFFILHNPNKLQLNFHETLACFMCPYLLIWSLYLKCPLPFLSTWHVIYKDLL